MKRSYIKRKPFKIAPRGQKLVSKRSKLAKKRKHRSEREILHDRAWKLQSLAIRTEGMLENGYNDCYTCGKYYHYTKLDAGHWKHGVCDFEPWNVHRQCSFYCNKINSGQRDIYMRRLQREYGVDRVDQFEAYAHVKGNYYSVEQLQKVINKYSSVEVV